MGFLFRLIFHILATALVFWLLEQYVFPGSFAIEGNDYMRYVWVALFFGLLNTFIKPLLKLFMLPVQLLTLGLAGLAVNGILMALLAFGLNALEFQSASVVVDHWLTYFVVGIVLGITNTVIHWFS
jgi:putative membrane protein